MKFITKLTIFFSFILAGLCVACSSPTSNSSTSRPVALTMTQQTLSVPADSASHYLLYLPPGYGDDASKTWPLMVYLHGSQAFSNLTISGLSTQGIFGYMNTSGDRLPAIVVQTQQDATIFPVEGNWHDPVFVDAVIKDVESRFAVDKTRVSITGGSLGGFGSWNMALVFPNRFAAVMPVVGGLCNDTQTYNQHVSLTDISDWGDSFQRIKTLPCRVGIGQIDASVPLNIAENPVKLLKASGGNPDVREFYATHGEVQGFMFSSEHFNWMLSQNNSGYSEDPVSFAASDYEGTYNAGSGTVSVVSDGKKLMLNYPGGLQLTFYCIGTDRFMSAWLMKAVRDQTGKVVKLTTPVNLMGDLTR